MHLFGLCTVAEYLRRVGDMERIAEVAEWVEPHCFDPVEACSGPGTRGGFGWRCKKKAFSTKAQWRANKKYSIRAPDRYVGPHRSHERQFTPYEINTTDNRTYSDEPTKYWLT